MKMKSLGGQWIDGKRGLGRWWSLQCVNKNWALILEKVDELVLYSVLDVCIAYNQKWT